MVVGVPKGQSLSFEVSSWDSCKNVLFVDKPMSLTTFKEDGVEGGEASGLGGSGHSSRPAGFCPVLRVLLGNFGERKRCLKVSFLQNTLYVTLKTCAMVI